MNSKMTTNNYQQLNLKNKSKTKQTRTGTESQKWRSLGGKLVGSGQQGVGGKGTGNKKHNW